MISRIRSDLRQYGTPPADTHDQETDFSARLFLAVAQENDQATAHLDNGLKQFKALEQGFLDSLVDSDAENFSRHSLGSEIWSEDPGAKHTPQRIRAWATLAAADSQLPAVLVTTSAAVVDTLMETRGRSDPSRSVGNHPVACFIHQPNAPPCTGAGRSGGSSIPGGG